VVGHAFNSSTQEAEVGRPRVTGQPRLHSKTLFQEKRKEGERKKVKVKTNLKGRSCLQLFLRD
jgi:hypothetical protein